MKQYCDKRWQCRSDKLWHNDISRYNSFRKWNIWFSKYNSGNEIYDFWIYPKQTQGSSRSQFIFNFQLKTNKERNKLTKEQTAKEKKHKIFSKTETFLKHLTIYFHWSDHPCLELCIGYKLIYKPSQEQNVTN